MTSESSRIYFTQVIATHVSPSGKSHIAETDWATTTKIRGHREMTELKERLLDPPFVHHDGSPAILVAVRCTQVDQDGNVISDPDAYDCVVGAFHPDTDTEDLSEKPSIRVYDPGAGVWVSIPPDEWEILQNQRGAAVTTKLPPGSMYRKGLLDTRQIADMLDTNPDCNVFLSLPIPSIKGSPGCEKPEFNLRIFPLQSVETDLSMEQEWDAEFHSRRLYYAPGMYPELDRLLKGQILSLSINSPFDIRCGMVFRSHVEAMLAGELRWAIRLRATQDMYQRYSQHSWDYLCEEHGSTDWAVAGGYVDWFWDLVQNGPLCPSRLELFPPDTDVSDLPLTCDVNLLIGE